MEILWASTREAYNNLQAKYYGCPIITAPPSIIQKISNFGKSIIKLLSGIAFLVFFTGIVTDLYDFWYGAIGAVSIGILAGFLNTILQSNLKKAIIKLIGGIAFLFIP